MEMPLCSVCLITYNHAKYIKEAIESVLMQKVDFTWELVIADDFSTDGTREIILQYKEKYPERIKLIFQEKNVGPCKNFLDLITSPTSKYVAYLEGDDYWTDPLKLQKQVDEMEKHPRCLMSCHPAIVKHAASNQPDAIKCNRGNVTKIFTTKEVIATSGTFCPTSSLVFQRKMLNNMPDFFLEMPDDYFIEVLGSMGGGLIYLSKPMSVYRSMSIGSWTGKNIKNFEYSLQYYLKYNGYLKALDAYLNYKYSAGIESKMSMMNYVMWRRFIKLDKKEFGDNYKNIKKQISQLKINKILLVKALLANKMRALLKPIL